MEENLFIISLAIGIIVIFCPTCVNLIIVNRQFNFEKDTINNVLKRFEKGAKYFLSWEV